MADEHVKALEELRLTLMNALTKVNSELFKAKRRANEDVSAQTGTADDNPLPLHSEVEHPDQGEPPTDSNASRRRGSRKLSNTHRNRK